MNCSQCQQHVLDYAYGELPDTLEREVAEALKSCPECREEVERLRATRSMVREGLVMHEPSGLLRANILREARKLHAEREEASVGLLDRFQSMLVHPSFAMAAGVLLVVCVTLVLQDRGTFDPSEEAPHLASAPIPSVDKGASAKADKTAAAQPPAASETPSDAPPPGALAADGDDQTRQMQADPAAEPSQQDLGAVAVGGAPAKADDDGIARVEGGKGGDGAEVAAAASKTAAPKTPPAAKGADSVWQPTDNAPAKDAKAADLGKKKRKALKDAPSASKNDTLALQMDGKREAEPRPAPAPPAPTSAAKPTRANVLNDAVELDDMPQAEAEATAKAKVAEASQRRSAARSSVDDLYRSGNVSSAPSAGDERERYGRGGYGVENKATDLKLQEEMRADEQAKTPAYDAPQERAEGRYADQDKKAYDAYGAGSDQDTFTEGNDRFNRGDYRGAVEQFNNFINEAPRTSNYHAQAIYRLGRSHMNLGQWNKAAGAFRRVLSEYPDAKNRAEIRYYLAQALLKANPKSTEAEQILNDLARGGTGGYAEKARSEHDRAFGRRTKKGKASPKAAPARKRKAPSKKSYDAEENYNYDQAPATNTQ